MKNYILILLFSTITFFSFAQEKDKTWVFILAGQSNMAGRGAIDMNPFNGDTITNRRIQTINQNGEIVLAKEPLHFYEPKMAGLDCGLSFARTMLLSIPKDVTILLIPTNSGISLTVIDNGIGPRDGSPGLGSSLFNSIAGSNWSLTRGPDGVGAQLNLQITQ
jgi:hypothetical protein